MTTSLPLVRATSAPTRRDGGEPGNSKCIQRGATGPARMRRSAMTRVLEHGAAALMFGWDIDDSERGGTARERQLR